MDDGHRLVILLTICSRENEKRRRITSVQYAAVSHATARVSQTSYGVDEVTSDRLDHWSSSPGWIVAARKNV